MYYLFIERRKIICGIFEYFFIDFGKKYSYVHFKAHFAHVYIYMTIEIFKVL